MAAPPSPLGTDDLRAVVADFEEELARYLAAGADAPRAGGSPPSPVVRRGGRC